MDRLAATGMQDLRNKITEMGGRAEEAIASAVTAFLTGDIAAAQNVASIENSVNRLHIRVDEICVKLLATQQPMGGDLRYIVSAIKINTDLERISDQAVNIAGNAKHALSGNPLERALKCDFSAMCNATRKMVRSAMDAFVNFSLEQAENVITMDDEVDALKRTIFDKVLASMESGETSVRQGLDLILIARNLEKVGDHASNIAEDIIYARSGRDIRHPYSRVPEEK
jgi:phosphate transport system protein